MEGEMMASHDALMKLTKDELVKRILDTEKAAKEGKIAEREVRIKSPAGPVVVGKGFVDDGEGPITIENIPEDEFGHWAPFWEMVVNGQNLGKPEYENGS
jgi:hypothetical protein